MKALPLSNAFNIMEESRADTVSLMLRLTKKVTSVLPSNLAVPTIAFESSATKHEHSG
jgi:hypothetical protein